MTLQVFIYLNGNIQVRRKDTLEILPKYNNWKHLHKLVEIAKYNKENNQYGDIRELECRLVKEDDNDISVTYIPINDTELYGFLRYIKK